MASNSEINLEKFMENPEFKEKLFGLIKETYSKSKLTESEDESSKTGSPSTKNNKRQSVGSRGRRFYKKRKITKQPSLKQNDVDEDIKLILEDEGIKKKIASYVDECIHLKGDSDGSSEERVVQTTKQDAKIINTTDDIKRLSVEEIEVPSHSVEMIKPCGRPPKSLKSVRKSPRQHESKFHISNENTTEISLDKEIGTYLVDPGAGVVVNDETKDDLPKKDDAIILDSSNTSNNELISTEITSVTDNNVLLEEPTDSKIHEEQSIVEQSTDLNTHEEQSTLEQPPDLNTNGEMSDVSQSDDFFYWNMARENQMSLSDVSEAPEKTNITSDVLNISNINNSSITTEPTATIPDVEEKIFKPVIKNNKKVDELSKIIKNQVIIPKLKNVIQLKCLGSNSTQSAPNFQTIFVVTQNGEKSFNMLQPVEVLKSGVTHNGEKTFNMLQPVEVLKAVKLPTIKAPIKKEVQPLKIPINNAIGSIEVPFKLQSTTKKLALIGTPSGAKPFIKSNELVNVQVIRTSGSGIDDSIVSDISDNKTNDLESADCSNLPKIENVISCAEGVPIITSVTSCVASTPIITNVTSCATSSPNIENMSTSVPSLQHTEDIISLAERISPDLITPGEKILKIKRKVTKGRGRKKLQSIITQHAENLESEAEKNSDSLNSSASIGATIEEAVTGEEVMHDMQSVVPEEKKSGDVVLHIDRLNVRNSTRKGLKVLKPVKRVDCVNSEIGDITIAAMESVDRSGLPSIQNVVSLAKNNVFDECLEEANLKLANGNGIYTTDITDEKFKVLQPRDDEFKSSDEFVETWDDVLSENGHFEDNFDYCVDSLIEDMSGKKSIKKSPYKNRKSSPPFSARQHGTSNGRNKGLKVLKPVIRKKKKKGKRKAIFTRRKIRRNFPSVKENIQNSKYDADVASINFADLSLVDTESKFVQNKYNDASFGQSIPNIADIPQSRISPMKALRIGKYFYDDDTNDVDNEQDELPNGHITEPIHNNSEAVVKNTADFSMEVPDEELIEEVPLQQRRCNNFYVKVPTGEELGSNINLEEYEKFFSIQDENDPTKIRKPVIESLHDDEEDLPGTPGKRRTKCSKCDKTFIHSVNRKIHEETCENNEPQKSECSKCGRWFSKTAYRKIHEKKCQVISGTIEIPITPLNDILRCAMCPFTTGHKTAYINHLKSHMYTHKKNTTSSAKIAAQRRKFGYRKKRRKVRFGPAEARCEVCNDNAGGVEHMVSRCRRCGAFNLQWCDECHQGGYSTACRLRHHEAQCSATPHTRCNDVPRVRVERLGPPLPLHCVSCDVTRILYIREKRCKQCSSQLLFKCEMCDELRDTFAELCGHVARAHIIGCLVQCNECGKYCEDLTLHRRTCERQPREEGEEEEHEDESNAASSTHELMYFSEDEESNEDTSNLGIDNLILELDEDSDENHEQIIEEI